MNGQRLGIDPYGEYVVAVRVDHDGGRPVVRSAERLESADSAEVGTARCVCAVPDRDVIVKSLHVRSDQPLSQEDRARFEMAASLLDPESEFTIDLIPTAREHRVVGLAYRRRDRATPPEGARVDGRMRAAALGMGYLAFGRIEPGDLLCLADIGIDAVSICLLYQKRIINLAHLSLNGFDPATERGCRQAAVELRTVVNFKLAELAEWGITVPLAKLILSGRCRDTALPEFTRLFPSGVARPSLNEAYFDERARRSGIEPERCMVALGLTVK